MWSYFQNIAKFEPVHEFSKFLWLNNFFLGAMKKPFMTFFKKCLRLSQIHGLCISRWENLIFSEGQPRKNKFLIFLPSSILLEAMKKKLATSSFPRYFYANSPEFFLQMNVKKKDVALMMGLNRFQRVTLMNVWSIANYEGGVNIHLFLSMITSVPCINHVTGLIQMNQKSFHQNGTVTY